MSDRNTNGLEDIVDDFEENEPGAHLKTYMVLFAQDVPTYGSVEIEAGDDAAAIEAAKAYWARVCSEDEEWPLTDAEYDSAVIDRIVDIHDPDGNMIIQDVRLDNYQLAYTPTPIRERIVTRLAEVEGALLAIIAAADDVEAAIAGVTDQFEDEVSRLSAAATALEKLLKPEDQA